jgi:hypothetical protein
MVDQGESFLLDLSGSHDNVGIVSVHYSIYRNISGKLSEVFSTPYFGVRVWNLTPVEYCGLDDLWLMLQLPGEYHVNVTLEDRRGLEGKASTVVNVRDSVPPTARTNRSLIVIHPGEAVYLSGSDSFDENGPVNFQWSLENGDIIGTGEELSWTPPGIGQYNITLRVIDGGGNSDETICRVQVIETAGTVGGADWTPVQTLWVVTAAAMIFIGIDLRAMERCITTAFNNQTIRFL